MRRKQRAFFFEIFQNLKIVRLIIVIDVIDCLRRIFFVSSKIKISTRLRWRSVLKNNKDEIKKKTFSFSFNEDRNSENLNNCLSLDLRDFNVNVFDFECELKFNEILKLMYDVIDFWLKSVENVVDVFCILITKFRSCALSRFWRTFFTLKNDEND